MRKPFQAGERVAIYDNRRWEAEITGIDESGYLYFSHPCLSGNPYHPKQCRRLIPKKRREIWIRKIHLDDIKLYGLSAAYGVSSQRKAFDDIRFIEAKERK